MVPASVFQAAAGECFDEPITARHFITTTRPAAPTNVSGLAKYVIPRFVSISPCGIKERHNIDKGDEAVGASSWTEPLRKGTSNTLEWAMWGLIDGVDTAECPSNGVSMRMTLCWRPRDSVDAKLALEVGNFRQMSL